jgi:gluconokinase
VSAIVVLVMGVSGAGKSMIAKALAERLGWTFQEGDAFHSSANVAKMKSGRPLDDADRAPWLEAIAAWIDREAAREAHVVLACSALKKAYRRVLMDGRPFVRLVYLEGSRALIAKRLVNRRGHYFPPQLLDSQFAALEGPGRDERPIIVDVGLPMETQVGLIAAALGV